MGGQMQQNNAAAAAAAATALYDHTAAGGSLHNPASTSDAGDAVMARWLQSAGLQHLASPVASTGIDHRLLPNLLMQGYGAQSAEEKQRLFKLMRNLNFNGESGSEPYTPTSQTSAGMGASDGFYSSDFRGDFGAGLLDLHAMDDTELLSDHVMSEPFETSPFMPDVSQGFENKYSTASSRQQKEQFETDPSIPTEKENSTRENNVAKIKVVVRKRPLNKKELSRKEDDVVTVGDNSLTVHETKLKVDLTAYVEKHEFCFDAVLDEHVTNDEVYRSTVEPIIPIIFQRTKATCFAYGQTGSGKTFTMQPLPLRAAADLVRLLHQPVYRNQKFKLWLSFFEIYGGKLYDLLSDRKKLCMREDGRQQVCIVGLQEFEVSDVQIVKEFIEKGNACRSTGSTGANEESSRSHAILQLAVKKHNEVKESRRNNNYDVNEAKNGRLVGKISFIDLAGSERGADTTDNDRQTRIEGAEINKSLLALKECIRALDNDQLHIPFRGSKLTEVLRDSFVGNSRTVMISCISPNEGSCEHTLNTLRYADRVKSLSKSGNSKKDQTVNTNKDASLASTQNVSADVDDSYEQQPAKAMDVNRRVVEKETASYIPTVDYDRQSSGYAVNGREGSGMASGPADRERLETNSSNVGSASTSHRVYSSSSQNPVDADEKVQKVSPPRRKSAREEKSEGSSTSTSQRGVYSSSSQNPVDAEEKVPKVSPPRRKTSREEKAEKSGNNWLRKDSGADSSSTTPRSQNTVNYSASTAPQSTLNYNGNSNTLQNANTVGSRRTVPEPPSDAGSYNANGVGSRRTVPDPPSDGNINAILEEEEALIAAHRKEIEDTMEIVREEMKLLAEVDRPGSLVDNYVTQLSFVLSRKAASLVSLQARLARFQHRLKEQEILSRKRVHR